MIDKLSENITGIDHIALAVPDLDGAISWIQNVLGFELEERRKTQGNRSGMQSAVLRLGPVTVVLTEGIGTSSQTSEFIETFGPGVHHVAFRVDNLAEAIDTLQKNGLEFSSPRLDSDGLSQIFAKRDPSTGLMVELIERRGFDGFRDENVQRLFDSLEEKNLV